MKVYFYNHITINNSPLFIFYSETLDVLRIQVAAKKAQREAAQRVIEQEAELMLHERELRQAVLYSL